MKKIILITVVLFIASFAEAKVYVCLDKSTGEPKGMTDIDEKTIGDWAKKFVMVEADESYRGKSGSEIKYEDQKLRHATEAEIASQKQAKEAEAIVSRKQKALDEIGLTIDDITRIKALK